MKSIRPWTSRAQSVVAGFALVALMGCASVTAIVTGKTRPAIADSAVQLYSTPPAHYEDIAIVSAASESGWTEQGEINNAITGLKQKAAELGANGLLIESAGPEQSGTVAMPNGSGGVLYAPVIGQRVKGRAIYIDPQ